MKKKIKITKKSLRIAIKTFSACLGITAVCMLFTANILNLDNRNTGNVYKNEVLEASVFNNNANAASTNTLSVSNKNVNKTDSISVIPMGTTFGIKLFTDGVIVASLSEVYTTNGMSCPAGEAGIKAGDYVLEANGEEIVNNSSLAKLISASEGKEINLKIKRGEEVFETKIFPIFSEGSFKAGMWIRDSAAGIGTLTFYNPNTGIFAGLGHAICDMDTKGIMTLKSGEPAEITICGIQKGVANVPGQLQGYFSSNDPLGVLLENNETGLYGKFNTAPQGNAMEVANKEEVETGDAQLLVSLDSSGPKLYSAKIQKIFNLDQRTKNFVIEVTDDELLSKTGGIVQGMSGCPIIQNGKLVGAVTHVLTEEPKTGYGIFADTMVKESVVYSMSN